MASSYTPTQQLSIPFAVEVIAPTFLGNRTYIPEPPMEEEKTMIWVSQVLTPFSISGFVHVFLGPLHGASEKPDELKKFFPCYYRWKPQTFKDKYYELGLMSAPTVFFAHLLLLKIEVYISWLDKVEKKKGWKDQMIFDLIQLSRFDLNYNASMIISTLFFGEGSRFGSLYEAFGLSTSGLKSITFSNLDQKFMAYDHM